MKANLDLNRRIASSSKSELFIQKADAIKSKLVSFFANEADSDEYDLTNESKSQQESEKSDFKPIYRSSKGAYTW